MVEYAAEHRCHHAIIVAVSDLGWWRYYRPDRTPISHCPNPKCGRRLTRRGLRLLDRDVRQEC